jgi:hypothetical protein
MSIQPSAICFQQEKEYPPLQWGIPWAEYGSLTAEGYDKDSGNV